MKEYKELPIVIIGQNYSTSLGVIKALGEAGYRCEVAKRVYHHTPRLASPEQKSRYVDRYEYIVTGDDSLMVEKIISGFSDVSAKKILIPTDDYSTALIDRNEEEFSRHFIVPNAKGPYGSASSLMDKHYQKQIVRQFGIMAVDTSVVDCRTKETIVIPDTITYPCFIKPLASAGHSKSLIQKCYSKGELQKALFDIADSNGCQMLVEKYVDIEREYTIPGMAINGQVEIVALFEKSKTGSGNHKGVTICGKVVPANICPSVIEKLKDLIKGIGFQGIFDIELLYSNGKYYFNELNLRNGAAGYALTHSGLNFPALYVNALLGKPIQWGYLLGNLKFGKTFVNEKAALDYYLAGYCSFSEFVRTIKRADIRFITTSNDFKPFLYFLRLIILSVISRYKNKLI